MTADPRRIKELFVALLDLPDPQSRQAFLERECGADAELRQRLEALLKAHENPASVLDHPLAAVDPVDPAATCSQAPASGPAEEVGTIISGRYKLLEQIGEGGMGTVWVAEQTKPVRRKVALKLIKAGMDSKTVLSRFEAERQALALMDHPNIAKVLDGGSTDNGRPYFVMEYVKGVPLTRYCDDSRLSIAERLALFVPICHAVQHAHQKGIIHRDLKPSNLLICLYDGKPVPKVIDFGLAKAMHQPLTEHTLHTAHGSMMGTPLYMSPEQAEFNNLDVDTRTDIYALGVILYELLTGTTPLEKQRFQKAAWQEILRLIKEEEPLRPSARLSGSGSLPSLAAQRQLEPIKLKKLVRGELDWIAMKCLEKDRSRRYDTANGLARDVERYLADEPVEACPPSARYRLHKFARKYKKALVTAAAFAVLLVVGAVISSLLAVWATSAEREANRQRLASDEAKQAALDAKQQALDAKVEAVKQRDAARLTAYASGMQLAQRAWEENDVVRARELLEEVPKEAGGRNLRGFEWYYLSRLCHSEALTLEGHTGPIASVVFSSDGKRLASGGHDNTVKIWDSMTGRELFTLNGHAGLISSVAFSPDGQRLASGSWDKTVKIWDSTTGKELLSLKGHEGLVKSVAFGPDGRRLASGSADQTVKMWDSTTGKELFSLTGATGGSRRRSYSADGGRHDSNYPFSVMGVAFSPDGRRLTSASEDGTASIWDSATGKKLLSIRGHAGQLQCVVFSPDGQRLAGAAIGLVTIWDSTTGKELFSLRGHASEITTVAFTADGRRLASGSWDKMVKIWDSATGKELFSLKGHVGPVMSVAFSPDGQRLASGSWDNTVKIWDCAIGSELFSFKVSSNSVAFSPNGYRLASGSRNNTVEIWDCSNGTDLFSLKGHADAVRCVAFTLDGRRLATGSEDTTVKIWESATGRELFSLKGHSGPVTKLAFSPDGQRLASGSWDNTVKIWDSASGKELFSFKHHDSVFSLAFSPDGQRLSGGLGNEAKIWDSVSGKELVSLNGHTFWVMSVAFSPDGKLLASGSADNTVKLWDSASGMELFSLKGHVDRVRSVAFSPDGQRLASGSDDKTVKLWDSATGKELFSLNGQPRQVREVYSVAFSSDGQRLICCTVNGSIFLWDTIISPKVQERQAANRLVAELFRQMPMRSDVLEHLRTLPGMSPSRRHEATTVAQTYPEDPLVLNTLAWDLVNLPGRAMPGYQKALRYSEEACQLEPTNGNYLNTLGVAYYRVGNYEKALATLLRSDAIDKTQFQGSIPADLAFLALTHQRLGHAKEAQASLQRLRERMKDSRWAQDAEAQGFLREAETLLAKPKTPGSK